MSQHRGHDGVANETDQRMVPAAAAPDHRDAEARDRVGSDAVTLGLERTVAPPPVNGVGADTPPCPSWETRR